MKTFVVLVSVVLVLVFMFAADTAAAPADSEDANPFNSVPSIDNFTSHYKMKSSKNPFYIIMKKVAKMILKYYSNRNKH